MEMNELKERWCCPWATKGSCYHFDLKGSCSHRRGPSCRSSDLGGGIQRLAGRSQVIYILTSLYSCLRLSSASSFWLNSINMAPQVSLGPQGRAAGVGKWGGVQHLLEV